MTRIVTDGAADLPARVAAVTVVRGAVRMGDKRWDGESTRFWSELGSSGGLPATEAPSADQLAAAYAGTEPVLAVHVSGELSQTVANAELAASGAACPVHVIDSRSLSVGTGLVVMAAREAVDAGVGGDRLVVTVEKWVDQLHLHALIDDADLLLHGGRAGLVAAKVGRHAHRHLVAVKGHVIPLSQVRHRRAAIGELIDHVGGHSGAGVTRWAVGHGDASDVEEFVERLAGLFGCGPSFVTLMGPPVGAHMGPRSLAVGFFSAA